MLVLVRPCYPDFLQDKLFKREHPFGAHWMEPYAALQDRARAQGIEIHTWDMENLERADVILFQDFPPKNDVIAARKRAPAAAFILQILESPLGRPYVFVKENHSLFDAILTYNWHLADEKRYFRYFLPVGDKSSPGECIAFADRRPCTLISSNRIVSLNGFLANRQSGGLRGLPGVGVFFLGWKVPLDAWFSQYRGELYTRRRRIAQLAKQQFPHALDVYGSGWAGRPMTWMHRIVRHQFNVNFKPSQNISKLNLLANYRFCISFENVEADVGYISEKLFDALLAGTAPVYLGDKRISDYIPPTAFVDAKRFDSDQALLQYIVDCSEAEWQKIISSGDTFIRSASAQRFFSDAFATRVLDVILKVATQTKAGRL